MQVLRKNSCGTVCVDWDTKTDHVKGQAEEQQGHGEPMRSWSERKTRDHELTGKISPTTTLVTFHPCQRHVDGETSHQKLSWPLHVEAWEDVSMCAREFACCASTGFSAHTFKNK